MRLPCAAKEPLILLYDVGFRSPLLSAVRLGREISPTGIAIA